jgi:CPA1 family monovalent cation:H+ antiporter
LIIIGLALSYLRIGGLGAVPFDKSVILGLVVPPVIFEAAMRTQLSIFRTVQKTVLTLAIFGVAMSAVLSGFALNIALGLPLAIALTFGVIVSPTDPVSIVNVLRSVRAPERLVTILETEAYFNDATAVILYPLAVSLSFSPLHSIGLFAYTLGGGAFVGLAVSGIAEVLYRLITEPLAETSFTIAVIFGSYFLAETLGVSGLIAVAIAGVYMGNRTMRTAMSARTRMKMTNFWEVVTFLAMSFAFLVIGLKTDFRLLIAYVGLIMIAFAVILGARLLSVYVSVGLARLVRERTPHSWTRVVALGGLRGAISIALVLSLPEGQFKDSLVAMTFGVALLSLVVQGEFLQLYLRRTNLKEVP